jgi:hypothetical protein
MLIETYHHHHRRRHHHNQFIIMATLDILSLCLCFKSAEFSTVAAEISNH